MRPSDHVWTTGLQVWQPALSVPGLFPDGALAQQLAAAPACPAPPPRQSLGDDPVMRMILPVGRATRAIVAGYLGLFSVLLIPAPLALTTGILAVREIKANPQKHGLGRAWFGIVMGSLGSIVLAILLVKHFS